MEWVRSERGLQLGRGQRRDLVKQAKRIDDPAIEEDPSDVCG